MRTLRNKWDKKITITLAESMHKKDLINEIKSCDPQEKHADNCYTVENHTIPSYGVSSKLTAMDIRYNYTLK
ncbi:MAG: hypothetical protein GY861_13870 [bacterium]|nr:hypothetical protein [bacterium]